MNTASDIEVRFPRWFAPAMRAAALLHCLHLPRAAMLVKRLTLSETRLRFSGGIAFRRIGWRGSKEACRGR
jgi:hypothetical protein